MKGLLLKDFINVKGQLALYLGIAVLWIGLGMNYKSAAFFSGVMQMFVVMVPLTTLAYDEKFNWEQFALTMPVSRKTLMQSKFVFTLIDIIVLAMVSFIGNLIISGNMAESFFSVLLICPIGVMINGVMMPIMFRFGVEKGKFVFLAILTLVSLAALGLRTLLWGSLSNVLARISVLLNHEWQTAALLWAAAMLIMAISMVISGRIYESREF